MEKIDYKNLFEEIINSDWFRKAYNNKSLGECPFHISELDESEDERIRKKLLALVKWSKSYAASGVTVEDANEMTAYLEKQEQKPLSPDEKMNHPLYLEGFDVGREVGKVESEQKPAWSEEDERMLSRCEKSIESSKQFADSDTFKKAKDNEINWLKTRFKFLKSQPKQEWSEEDETKLNDVIRIIENHCGLVESIRNHYVKFLKSLRPSWKPSEEQMEALEIIVRYGDKESTHIKNLTSLYEDLKKLM